MCYTLGMSTERGPHHEVPQSFTPLLERTHQELLQMSPGDWADAEFESWGRRFDIPDADEATRELFEIASETFPGTFVPFVMPDVAELSENAYQLSLRWILVDSTPLPRRLNESVPLPYAPVVPTTGKIKRVGPDPFEEIAKEQIKAGNVQKPVRGTFVPGCRYDLSAVEVEKILNACGDAMRITEEPIKLPTPREMVAIGARADWRQAVLGPAEGRQIWPHEMTMLRTDHIQWGLVSAYDWGRQELEWGNRQQSRNVFTPFSPNSHFDGKEMEMDRTFVGYRAVMSNTQSVMENHVLIHTVSRRGFEYNLTVGDFSHYAQELDEHRVAVCGGQAVPRKKLRNRYFGW